jgi:hypothetical protein
LPADPKPWRRHVATFEEWEGIYAEKVTGQLCRGCGTTTGKITGHHMVPKSLGGDDVAANIIPLCGSGTQGCHGAIEDHNPGWEAIATAVRESLSPLELQYALAKKGRYWLDRYLPHDEQLCARCKKALAPPRDVGREALPPRKKKHWTLSVPDDAENGADILDTLCVALAEALGFDDETSRLRRYHAVNVALVYATLNTKELVEELGK